MENNQNDSQGKERIVNFALLIQKRIGPEGISFHIESQNQGVPVAEVAVIAEGWVEKLKNHLKDTFTGGINFSGHQNPK